VNLWYRVTDLDIARAFYEKLGFVEVYRDEEGRWCRIARGDAELSLTEDPSVAVLAEDGAVFTFDVDDVRAEADRLRQAGVQVGVVVEIPGTIRLLDAFDPDGNRVQLTEPL
jgi:predicted enzyme related to lactoylglutathione lyase